MFLISGFCVCVFVLCLYYNFWFVVIFYVSNISQGSPEKWNQLESTYI